MKWILICLCFFSVQPLTAQEKPQSGIALWKGYFDGENDLSKTNNLSTVKNRDFGQLWTLIDNWFVFGFCGPSFQRMKVKILIVKQDKKNPVVYHVTLKTKIKDDIKSFKGDITLYDARMFKTPHKSINPAIGQNIKKEGIVFGKYLFKTDDKSKPAVQLAGEMCSEWYIDAAGVLKYDNIAGENDGFCNDLFQGTWKDEQTHTIQICNWGDYRIPQSRGLDVGKEEFSPSDRCLKYGWQNYRDAFGYKNDKRARMEEEKKWWE